MPKRSVGLPLGSKNMINALGRIEGFVDCGVFRPLRIWSVRALIGRAGDGADMVENSRKRKNGPRNGPSPRCGEVQKPKAATSVRATTANGSGPMGSMASPKLLLREAKVAPPQGCASANRAMTKDRAVLLSSKTGVGQKSQG